MKNKLSYTFNEDLAKRLKNPDFAEAWAESEPEYLLATQLIEARLTRKLSQRALAEKVQTTQAEISRIETMQANPSLGLLKRIAGVLGLSLVVQMK